MLKAAYTPEARKKLAALLRRVEYEIDLPETVGALWALVDKEGFTADYIARFVATIIVHGDSFRTALAEHSPKERLPFLDEATERLEKQE